MWLRELELAVLLVAALALLGLVALVLHLRYWDRKLGVALPYDMEERIATTDGTVIELRRLPPPEEPAHGVPPVILVHGLGANHRNNDCLPDYSLARHLRDRGRDVWLLTLRSGLVSTSRAARRLVRFHAMVQHDLPLAIAEVLARTGAERLDYVGFSMGGMLLYAAIERSVPQQKLRRVAIIGSPAVIRTALPRWMLARAAFGPNLPLRLLSRASAFASEWLRTPLHNLILNLDNVEPGVARVAMANLVSDIPSGLNADFATFALEEGALRQDGEPVLARLAEVRVPALFFAGAADRIAPPRSVRVAYEAWGAAHPEVKKRFVLLARSEGAGGDYGHGDMVIGRRVKTDVFEPIGDFLGAVEA